MNLLLLFLVPTVTVVSETQGMALYMTQVLHLSP